MNSASALGHELSSSLRPQATPTMFVVDDVSVCESLELLIHCEGGGRRHQEEVRGEAKVNRRNNEGD